AIGLTIYLFGWKTLPADAGTLPNPLKTHEKRVALLLASLAVAVVAVLIVTSVLTLHNLSTVILAITSFIIVAYFAMMLRSKQATNLEKRKVVAFIPIFITAVLFWTLILQLFTTFAV